MPGASGAEPPALDLDPESIGNDTRQALSVCRECRLCAGLCPAFAIVLGEPPPEVGREGGSAGARWTDLCHQCGLCRAGCPFAPGSGGASVVDVPRLVVRERIVRTAAGGRPWGGRLRANPDLLGAAGSLLAPIANRWAVSRTGRRLLERCIGLSPEAPLPRFHRTPFDRWFRKREKRLARKTRGTGGMLVLFPGCEANYHEPGLGRSAVAVLSALDVRLAVPEQRCCGLHALEAGAIETVRENVRANTRALARHVAQGCEVAVLRAGCAAMLREEAPRIVPEQATREVAGSVRRMEEILERLQSEGRFAGRFTARPGRLLVHVGCRQRVLGGDGGFRLLEAIPGSRVERLDLCCGGSALWRGDRAAAEKSREQRETFLDRVRRSGAPRMATDCFYAALLVREACGIPVAHPVEIVRVAMGLPEEP